MMMKYKKKFSFFTTEKGQFSKRVLILSFIIVVAYTIVGLYLQAKYLIPLNDTLTEWVFKFFGIEICLLMLKRTLDFIDGDLGTKVKNKLTRKTTKQKEETEEIEITEDP